MGPTRLVFMAAGFRSQVYPNQCTEGCNLQTGAGPAGKRLSGEAVLRVLRQRQPTVGRGFLIMRLSPEVSITIFLHLWPWPSQRSQPVVVNTQFLVENITNRSVWSVPGHQNMQNCNPGGGVAVSRVVFICFIVMGHLFSPQIRDWFVYINFKHFIIPTSLPWNSDPILKLPHFHLKQDVVALKIIFVLRNSLGIQQIKSKQHYFAVKFAKGWSKRITHIPD